MSDDDDDKQKKSLLMNDVNQDIPIFLRKTYHMIDTCDKDICSWSEDGETFVVKNPTKFEKDIIPQFFKHNKFSSFVRQLNFYAFRKIKTNNSIRIDPALEKATANFWRFYHPKFQRGRPDWLKEIKRSSSTPRGGGGGSSSATSSSSGSAAAGVIKKKGGYASNVSSTVLVNGKNNNSNYNNNDAVVPNEAPSSSSSSMFFPTNTTAVVGQKEDSSELKSEVTTLKERIEAMNKNIDLLTTMVQNVTVAQQTGIEDGNNNNYRNNGVVLNENNKRSKISSSTSSSMSCCVPDEMISSSSSLTFATITTDDDVEQQQPPQLPSMPSLMMSGDCNGDGDGSSNLFTKETSQSSELSDEGFVDTLFTAFKGEDDDSVAGDLMMMDMGTTATTTKTIDVATTSFDSTRNDNITKLYSNNNKSPWLNSTSISSMVNENQNDINNIANNKRQQQQQRRRPRAELMNRLSDALSLLPRDIQELIVDRLIQAITSPKEIQSCLNVTNALKEVAIAATVAGGGGGGASRTDTDLPVSTVPQSPKNNNKEFLDVTDVMMMTDDDDGDGDDDMDSVVPSAANKKTATNAVINHNNPTLPLAAATLAALLSQYGKQEQQCAAAVANAHVNKSSNKVLIPVHA